MTVQRPSAGVLKTVPAFDGFVRTKKTTEKQRAIWKMET